MMETIPAWAVYATITAVFQAFVPLIQERYNAHSFALSVGIKVVVFLATLPFLLYVGLPTDPAFYIGLGLMSVIWCINDVYYYRAIGIVGAGVVTRLLPATTIATFVMWFAFDPSLLDKYLAQPLLSAGVVGCILLAAYCASHLSKCQVTRQAVRLLWFVLFAAAIGPIAHKLILGAATSSQGPYAYACIEALMMLVIWSVYAVIKKPVPRAVWLAPATLKASLGIGLVASVQLVLASYAFNATDHPSYVAVILFTDALWVLLVYRLVGRRETANVGAGLGIVAAAAGLVLLKSL